MSHPPLEALSALVDGELTPGEARPVRAHVNACPACRADLSLLARLDDQLRLIPSLTCGEAARLLSATFDDEAAPEERSLIERHLAGCQECRSVAGAWTAIDRAIVGRVVYPSPKVDRAMAALTAPPPAADPLSWAPGLPLRAGLAGALAIAIVIVASLAGAPAADPRQAAAPPGRALFAGRQLALHERTNTLYVVQPEAGLVRALDATTHEERTVVRVGGRPSALALDQRGDRVIVLDAEARTLTEIDVTDNRVVGRTQLDLEETPTGVQFDEATRKILVTTVAAPPGQTPAGPDAVSSPGHVAVFNAGTKEREQFVPVDAAPRVVVTEPDGSRTLLVTSEATTLVDGSYRRKETFRGGVSAAFGAGGRIAVLSRDGTDALLTFHGERAPGSLRLPGAPAAVVGLRDGRFAVLVEADGGGRIFVIDSTGRPAGEVPVGLVGDLAYDANAQSFTVSSGGTVARPVPMPAGAAIAGQGTPAPTPAESPALAPSEAPPATEPSPSPTPEPASSPTVR
ncbi:MAG TPA: zf-HC2 domain-containing protein, partial [Solirubrobacteraceae bacterium]|nr:zf-HC2 domain-containing protein [Solirubrobacteraceae bacterium]